MKRFFCTKCKKTKRVRTFPVNVRDNQGLCQRHLTSGKKKK